MLNPFPGIDPYVEASGRWPDFHVTFMGAWREAIAEQLPNDYDVRLEEQLSILDYEENREQKRSPDLTILQTQSKRTEAARTDGPVSVLEPELSKILVQEEIRQAYIEIIHEPEHRLVAVLELLSPTNKTGDGRSQYLAKRHQILLSEAHLVELDLLLGGRPLPLDKPVRPSHFRSVISRAGRRPGCNVYGWSLDQGMPILPVPLSDPDPDIAVNLADVLATTYQRGRYHKTLKYHAPLDLPLSDDYHAWVKERITAARGQS